MKNKHYRQECCGKNHPARFLHYMDVESYEIRNGHIVVNFHMSIISVLPDKDTLETHGFPTGFALPSFAENSRSPTLSQSRSEHYAALRAAGLGFEPRYSPP